MSREVDLGRPQVGRWDPQLEGRGKVGPWFATGPGPRVSETQGSSEIWSRTSMVESGEDETTDPSHGRPPFDPTCVGEGGSSRSRPCPTFSPTGESPEREIRGPSRTTTDPGERFRFKYRTE